MLEVIKKENLPERSVKLGSYIMKRLEKLKAQVPFIREIRGKGLMIGIELSIGGREIGDACREKRLLINCTQERVLRLLPAMTITKDQLDKGLKIFEAVLLSYKPV